MMRVVIVDDEPLARDAIRVLVARDPELVVAGECSGVEAPELIARTRPHILFLDVQMPELDGFDVLNILGTEPPAVVFVTAYDEYALRAFDVHAIDYLLKPFDDRRFALALRRAKERVRDHGEPRGGFVRRFLVRSGEKVVVVKSDDIDWIEAADYYVSLHVGAKAHLLRETMSELETRLDPERFFRVHRSAIVNLERVAEIHPLFRGDCTLVLSSGAQVRLSRSRREDFERRFHAPA